MIGVNGGQKMTLRDLNGLALVMALVPMVVTGVFVILSFWRIGYGTVAKYLTVGFTLLGVSLGAASINMLFIRDDLLGIGISIIRILGWVALAAGFIKLFSEADRSIP